jgi:hypothetical protein
MEVRYEIKFKTARTCVSALRLSAKALFFISVCLQRLCKKIKVEWVGKNMSVKVASYGRGPSCALNLPFRAFYE